MQTALHSFIQLGVVALLVTLAGCSMSASQDTSGPAHDTSYIGGQQLCDKFARTIYTLDTRADSSPAEAWKRAKPLVSKELAQSIDRQPEQADYSWSTLSSHDGYTVVFSEPLAGDSVVADEIASFATVEYIGRDGWKGPTETFAVHCDITSAGHRPHVSSFSVEYLSW